MYPGRARQNPRRTARPPPRRGMPRRVRPLPGEPSADDEAAWRGTRARRARRRRRRAAAPPRARARVADGPPPQPSSPHRPVQNATRPRPGRAVPSPASRSSFQRTERMRRETMLNRGGGARLGARHRSADPGRADGRCCRGAAAGGAVAAARADLAARRRRLRSLIDLLASELVCLARRAARRGATRGERRPGASGSRLSTGNHSSGRLLRAFWGRGSESSHTAAS